MPLSFSLDAAGIEDPPVWARRTLLPLREKVIPRLRYPCAQGAEETAGAGIAPAPADRSYYGTSFVVVDVVVDVVVVVVDVSVSPGSSRSGSDAAASASVGVTS